MKTAALLLLVLSPVLGGCIQFEEIWTVFPDGSGKVHLKIAFRKTMMKMLEEAGKAEGLAPGGVQGDLLEPAKLFAGARGFVALRQGTASEQGEWARNSVTGYFDHINDVRLGGKAGQPGGSGFQARLVAGTLTMSNRLHEFRQGFDQGAAQRGATPEQIKASLEFLKPMMEGLQVRVVVLVPGTVTEASGFMSKEAGSVSSEVNAEVLLAMRGEAETPASRRLAALMDQAEASVSWSPEGFDSSRLTAWKAEFADAKAAGAGALPRTGAAPAAPEKPRSLADDAGQFTDDEVERLFIDAQLKIARGQLDRGQKPQARETLQGILKDYPKAKAAQEAKKLLDGLK